MPASNYKIPQYNIPVSLMSWVRLGHKSLIYYHAHQSSTHSQLSVQDTLLRISSSAIPDTDKNEWSKDFWNIKTNRKGLTCALSQRHLSF